MTSHLLFSKLRFAAELKNKNSSFCTRPQVMQSSRNYQARCQAKSMMLRRVSENSMPI